MPGRRRVGHELLLDLDRLRALGGPPVGQRFGEEVAIDEVAVVGRDGVAQVVGGGFWNPEGSTSLIGDDPRPPGDFRESARQVIAPVSDVRAEGEVREPGSR